MLIVHFLQKLQCKSRLLPKLLIWWFYMPETALVDPCHFVQASAEGRGLGMKNWRKEIVCILRVCDRGGGILVVCPCVCM